MSDRTCSIEGCAKPVRARGWCTAHYQRWQRCGDPAGDGRTQSPAGAGLAFIDWVVASATDECIPWPYAISDNGYGRVQIAGRPVGVHRVVLDRTTGPAPAQGMHAAHAPLICHNRACVNPRHLRWADPKGNNGDKHLDGTDLRGEANPNAKLTAEQVREIRVDHRPPEAVASEYGLHAGHVTNIRRRRTWKWL